MATLIAQRSTWWVRSGGSSPSTGGYGDYRYFWNIQYEQSNTDRANNRTKIIVDYYLQLNFNEGGMMADVGDYPSGTSTCYINGASIGSISTSAGRIQDGTSYALTYLGQRSTYIYHNNDGTGSFTFQGNGFGKGTAVSTYSTANGNFPSIPRGSDIGSVPEFNVDNGVTVTSSKKVSSYYDRLRIYIGSTLIKTIDNFESGTNVKFTESELNNIYETIPLEDYGTFTFSLSTYSSSDYGTQIGVTSSTNAKGNLTIISPSFSNFNYSDTNDKTYTLTGDRSIIVKGYSTVTVSITSGQKAVAKTRGATISHYIVNGQTLKEESGTISIPLENFSEDNVSVTAVDSRNKSSTTVNISFSALGKFVTYSPLFVEDNYDYVRSDNEVGESVTINFEGQWWNGNFGNKPNTIEVKYTFKKSTEGSYQDGETTIVPIIDSNNYSYVGVIAGDTNSKGFDVSQSYDIVVTIEDKLSSQNIVYDLHAGEPAIAIFGNKCALGAAYDEGLGGTQIWGDIYINGSAPENEPTCVVETGSNANGKWIKYSDGMMICSDTVQVGAAITQTLGSGLYYGYIDNVSTFPQAFIEPPDITFNHHTSSAIFAIQPYDLSSVTTTKTGGIYPLCPFTTADTNHFYVSYIAIGKWK